MRYVYEKLTSRALLRRVVEHEVQTGKRVAEVVLTHPEWREFINNEAPKNPTYAPVYNTEESILTVRPEK